MLNWPVGEMLPHPSTVYGLWGTHSNRLHILHLPVVIPKGRRITEAILYNLLQITTAGGYNYTVREANCPAKSVEQFKDYPAINVYTEERRTGWETQNWLKEVAVTLDCYLHDINNPSNAQDKMLADVQKRFGSFYWVPDSNGSAVAANCVYYKCLPFGVKSTVPLIGVNIQLVLQYRQQIINPSAVV